MNIDKQSMKLYTEGEILSFLKKEFADEIHAETFMENLTPIELPSDEEICKESYSFYKLELQYNAFIKGAKWMRNKTQGGNK